MTIDARDQDTDLDQALVDFDVYDPRTPEILNDVLDHTRGRCPVSRSEKNGGYFLVSAYEEVSSVLTEEATPGSRFSSRGGKSLPAHQTVEMPPIDVDPPEHRNYRRLLNRFFSKQGAAAHEQAITDIANGLLDDLLKRDSFDLLLDYATPLTAATLCRAVLNIEDPDLMSKAMAVVEPIGAAQNSGPEVWQNLNDFLAELIGAHEISGRDDAFEAVLTAEFDGVPLTDLQKLGVVTVLFLGGMDTTRAQIGCIGRHIVLNPGLEDRVRNPDWIKSDLDEFLRHDSVVSAMARKVTCPANLGGVDLEESDRLLLHYYGANHDPAVFEDPHELRFDRDQNPHLAFAAGPHRCLGSSLARLEIKVAFAELLRRVENLRLVPGSDISIQAGISRMPKVLPVTFDLRSPAEDA